MNASALSHECLERLTCSGIRTLARVAECDRVSDVVVAIAGARLALVRCAKHASAEDRTALATMISQGDFIWGAIVYSESALPDPLGLIESFHVDELDQLVSRLVELRGVLDEAG